MTLSTTESEYIALTEVTREVIFLRQILDFIEPSREARAVTIFEDNDGAIKLAENPICKNRTKHIDARYHFVRETVAN